LQQHDGARQLKVSTTIDFSESFDGDFPDQAPHVQDEPAGLNSSNSSDLAPSDHEDSSDDDSVSFGFG